MLCSYCGCAFGLTFYSTSAVTQADQYILCNVCASTFSSLVDFLSPDLNTQNTYVNNQFIEADNLRAEASKATGCLCIYGVDYYEKQQLLALD